MRDNDASFGGGIHNDGGTLAVTFSTISGNTAFNSGGGINLDPASGSNGTIQIVGSTISGNSTFSGNGGGIHAIGGADLTVSNSTIANNSAASLGGGLYLENTTAQLNSTIVAGNDDQRGFTDVVRSGGTLNADHSLFQTSTAGTINGTNTSNLTNVDPLLGPLEDSFNTGTGSGPQIHRLLPGSPAIDAGLNPLNLAHDQRGVGFARVRGFAADIGAVENETFAVIQSFVVGNGKTDRISVYGPAGAFRFDISAFGGDRAINKGLSVATGDVNGDGVEDVVVGATASRLGPVVKVFDGTTGTLLNTFFAFDPTFRGGINVAAGDVNGDGSADIVVGADTGRLNGPSVRIFNGNGAELGNLDPYAGLRHPGIRVAVGDVNGDGFGDIIAAPVKSSFGALIRVFSGESGRQIDNFLAYDDKRVRGVFVSAGDVNGDGIAEIITGADAGSASAVRAFSRPGFGQPSALLADFTVFASNFKGGVRVATADVNGDGIADIIAASGRSTTPQVVIFSGIGPAQLNSLSFTETEFRTGIYVG